MGAPTYPTIYKRSVLGVPLTNEQMDSNWTNLQGYDLTLANLIAGSLNPDGTLVNNSVGSSALQAAAVTLASLNPTLLYNIIPVDEDTGTVGAYAITARGGLGGSNLITGGATYDANGNYVLTNLTLNYGYYWTKGANDTSIVVNSQLTLTASGAYSAIATSVTLTGTPSATVTATVVKSAPISAYTNGQMFFVYTQNANVGPSTLNVNNIGAIPILQSGHPLQGGVITSASVFAVVYQSGSFVLFNSGGSSSGSSSNSEINYTFNNTQQFSTGLTGLPGSATTLTIAHGLGAVPQSYKVLLYKNATDSTAPAVGEYVDAGQFFISTSASLPAFTVTADATYITITQAATSTPSLAGTAITAASWNLVVNATKQTQLNNIAFPALTYLTTSPAGAFSYQNYMVTFNLGKTTGQCNGVAVNMQNNTVASLSVPNVAVSSGINPAVFMRASGIAEAVFTSSTGIFHLPALNPVVSVVPAYATYNGSGIYSFTITASTAYTLTQGANDISWSLDGVTYNSTWPGSIPSSNSATTLYLKGNPLGSVTAKVLATAATWGPLQVFSGGNQPLTKPVWIKESGGSITDVYAAGSNYQIGSLSGINLYHTTSGTSLAVIGTAVDLTNSGINNIAKFAGNAGQWYAAGSGAHVLLFQYNPVNGRIYVITNEVALMHIFQITGTTWGTPPDISSWWAASSGRYAGLSYIKSLAISGDGAPWFATGQENITVDFDPVLGTEKAIVFTRVGNNGLTGSITRIPWIEG